MLDAILDTVLDTLKMLPFLFVTYLIMEYIEQKAGDKFKNVVKSAGKVGPLWGGMLGVFPQCGFSAASSGLYVGRIVTLGTLIAIYLSTSDEMLPIFISESVSPIVIAKILATKMVIGVISGFIIDIVIRIFKGHGKKNTNINSSCDALEGHEHDNQMCNCNHKRGIWLTALSHTFKTTLFIFIVSLMLNLILFFVPEETLSSILIDVPVLGEMLAGLVGLIPNCAASVVITELYLEGIINPGAMISGLLVSAGAGTLVLFRNKGRLKENISIIALLYIIGVLWGVLIEFVGISF